MDELRAVSVPDMAELRVSGAACPLLPEYDIGPMLYDGLVIEQAGTKVR